MNGYKMKKLIADDNELSSQTLRVLPLVVLLISGCISFFTYANEDTVLPGDNELSFAAQSMKYAKRAYLKETRNTKESALGFKLVPGNWWYTTDLEDDKVVDYFKNVSLSEKGAILADLINSHTYFMSRTAWKEVKKDKGVSDLTEATREEQKAMDKEVAKAMDIAIPMFLENHVSKYLKNGGISKDDLKNEDFIDGFESEISLNSNTTMPTLKVRVTPKSIMLFAEESSQKDKEGSL